MQEATKARVLRCPCGHRMQACNDEALCGMLHEHIELEHPYTDSPPDERVKEMVSSAAYGFGYVPARAQDGLQKEGFGPEPY